MTLVRAGAGKNIKTVAAETDENMNDYRLNIKAAAKRINEIVSEKPEYAIVLGSGLSSLTDLLTETIQLPYNKIPGFPKVTVSGHDGLLIYGKLSGVPVLLMKGRFHFYEGHSIEDVVFPFRVMLQIGIKNLILTNAAGGINSDFKPGDIMIIKDHIGLFCDSPLRGENFDEFGPRFPDQSNVYNYKYAVEIANRHNIPVNTGIYAYAKGPMYETPAEIRLFRALGADAVGMSTVPEAIIAYHGGMNIIGISCITNFAAGILDQPLSHKEVLEVGLIGAKNIKLLIENIVRDGISI